MRIAVLSDIHANLPALNACLEKLEELPFDRIISLGDQVGYGPYPNEVIDLLRTRRIPTVLGNHDAGAVGQISLRMFREPNHKLMSWTKKNLSQENRDYLQNAPLTLTEGNWIAAHASPVDPDRWAYLNSAPRCRAVLSEIDQDFCLVGHTHVPGIVASVLGELQIKEGCRYVINPGSIGQPRDGTSLASFGILDTEAPDWEFYQVPWSREKMLKGYEKIGMTLKEASHLLMM